MTTEINEKIRVGVVFDNSRIKPKWFVWNNNKYDIKETTYTWQSTRGEMPLLHFSVTDGKTLFELTLNRKTFGWMLERSSGE